MIQKPLQRILVFPLTAENFVPAFQKALTHSRKVRPRIRFFNLSVYAVCFVYRMLLHQIWKKINKCLSVSTRISASELMLSIRLKGIRYLHMKKYYYCEPSQQERTVGTECISNNLKCIQFHVMPCFNQ